MLCTQLEKSSARTPLVKKFARKSPYPRTKVPVQEWLCITSGLCSIRERLLPQYKKNRLLDLKGKFRL